MLVSNMTYFLLFVILAIVGFVSSNSYRNNESILYSPELFFLIAVFSIFSGIRYNVGVDYLAYLNNYTYFQEVGMDYLDKEFLFEVITRLFASLDIHFSVYFGFLAFLQIIFVVLAFKTERKIFRYLPILLLLGTSYLYWMNAIRHMIAAGIFLYSLRYIQQKSLLKYSFFIFLAYLFHKSAIILIPFYFILQYEPFSKRSTTLTVLVTVAILQSIGFFKPIIESMSFVLDLLGYHYSYENFEYIMEKTNERNFGPRSLILILIPLTVILYSDKLKIAFEDTKFNYCYYLTVLGLIGTIIIADLPVSFGRIVDYFTYFTVFSSCYLLLYFDTNKKTIHLLTYLMLTCSYLPLTLYALDYSSGVESISFKFFWDFY
ncbi:EpsG family protein [Vibrio natriegens]|uniref:EpsG family protein n=1 Tax=Vibrio natriegens TaxID=691 RepID=UPI003F8256CA